MRPQFFIFTGVMIVLSGYAAHVAGAQDEAPNEDNPVLTRPGLLDGPGSAKEALREHGIELDIRWTQFYQGLVSGNDSKRWEYGGRADIGLNFDGEKIGLWPGFSIALHQQLMYGDDLLGRGGSSFPVNTGLAFPRVGGRDAETILSFTQQFDERISLSLGKFYMPDLAGLTPLVGGGGLDTFMNLGLAAPASGVIPAYILGGALNIQTESATFNLLVFDPRNAQDSRVLGNLFDTGVNLSPAVSIPVEIAGRDGLQHLRWVYSTQKGIDLRDIPELDLPPELRGVVREQKRHWYVAYSFQQFLWQDPVDPDRGWGIFGEYAISDGNPNPLAGHYFFGLAGNSFIPGRRDSDDQWGVAYFNYQLSDVLRDAVRPLGEYYGSEEGIETFYNFAVTPWFRITGDLQFINPFPADVGQSVIAGIRVQVRF